MAEVYARGPVAAGIDANPLDQYVGGVITDTPAYEIQYIVSIVGWGETKKGVKYWVVRNSWGEYWGEMGVLPDPREVSGAWHGGQCCVGYPASWTSTCRAMRMAPTAPPRGKVRRSVRRCPAVREILSARV